MHFKELVTATIVTMLIVGCGSGSDTTTVSTPEPTVQKANVAVQTNLRGLTIEQENIQNRLLADNKVGSIKHLYVISAYSGQVIIYSTVKGKVTSSGKRLNPATVAYGENPSWWCPSVDIRGKNYHTTEIMQDDGAYGSSDSYLYWWDTRGIYHQHYVAGGQILHISDEPIAVKSVIINMEAR